MLEYDARGHAVSHEYDARNRKVKTTVHLDAGDAVAEFAYDGVGNLTEERQANGNVVSVISIIDSATVTINEGIASKEKTDWLEKKRLEDRGELAIGEFIGIEAIGY